MARNVVKILRTRIVATPFASYKEYMDHVEWHHSAIATQKVEMFKNHSKLFPESRGRNVFIGDDGQGDVFRVGNF